MSTKTFSFTIVQDEESLSSKRPFSADFARTNQSDLPSSELFKHLLSEPIRSWRNYSPDLPENNDNNIEATSIVSLASGCSTTVVDENKTISNNENKTNECVLLPGLTTKPPLPTKKNEINKTDTEKIETITVCDALDELPKNKEVMFQNWITEEENLESEIILSERQTDHYFDSLKNDNKQTKCTAKPMKADDDDDEVSVEMSEQRSTGGCGDVLGDLEGEKSESACSGVAVDDNGTYDDIVTLLKILEDQDKKSRI